MRFYTKKRRMPQLIIMSLVDILAILLIFFIVTTTFREPHPQLEINLPESKTAAPSAASQKKPLILRVKDAANIMLNDQPVSLARLGEAIRNARRASPESSLAMQADREAPFGVVVQVLDALKEAGIKNIPAFTEPGRAEGSR